MYTASSSFSFTCVTVSQFRLFTVTSGAFSFSGFTQCSVYKCKGRKGKSIVSFRPEGQHRLEVITIDVLEHDPVVVFDLQRNTSYDTSESVLKSRRGAQLAIYSYQYRHNNDLAGWILY